MCRCSFIDSGYTRAFKTRLVDVLGGGGGVSIMRCYSRWVVLMMDVAGKLGQGSWFEHIITLYHMITS